MSEYEGFTRRATWPRRWWGWRGRTARGSPGLNLQYDQLVRGAPVELQFYHDALGHPILDSPLALKNAQPGARLELTIDSSIQSEAENYLTDQVRSSGARRGAAVVLDPFTGEVLALANSTADPIEGSRPPARYGGPGRLRAGLDDEGYARRDRAGRPRDRSRQRQIFCENGEWHLAGRTIHDDSRHGWLDLGGIIEVSSNIGAAKIALTLGPQRFYDGLDAFGLGRQHRYRFAGRGCGIAAPACELAADRARRSWLRTGRRGDADPARDRLCGDRQRRRRDAPIRGQGGLRCAGNEILRHTPQALRRAVSPEWRIDEPAAAQRGQRPRRHRASRASRGLHRGRQNRHRADG